MSGVIFKFVATATNEDLHLRFRVDHRIINDLKLPMNCDTDFWCLLDESQGGTHTIEIDMWGKLPEHTKLDEQGHIIQDRVIKITNVVLGRQDITGIFSRRSRYHHDYNGTGQSGDHDFHGIMGCNGTVRFEFESPHRIWLLEND